MRSTERKYTDPMALLRMRIADKTTLPAAAEVAFGLQYENIANFGIKNEIYEFLTQEYIDAFGDYLAARIEPLYTEKKGKATILEVGAGDGRLSHFLREEGLKDTNALCNIYAVDDGSWGIKRRFPVGIMNHNEALKRCQPDIVITSWMPEEMDITPAFRATPSVKEYILIGDPHNCGTNETYGISPNLGWDDWIDEGVGGFNFRNPPGYVPPHSREGFERVNLQDLGKLQIGLTDQSGIGRSRTISFRRR